MQTSKSDTDTDEPDGTINTDADAGDLEDSEADLQTGTDADTSTGVSRRTLLQAGGTAAGATVGGVGLTTVGTDEAEAIAATTAIGLSVVGGAAAGYLINEGVDNITGDDFNAEEYQDATAEEVHLQIYKAALSAYSTDDTVLTTINNQVGNSENVAWAKGKIAGIDEFDAGNDVATAKSAAHTAIDDYYSIIQRNLTNHFTEQCNKLQSWKTTISNTSGLSAGDVYNTSSPSDDYNNNLQVKDNSVTLLNGEVLSTYKIYGRKNSYSFSVNYTNTLVTWTFPAPASADSSTTVYYLHRDNNGGRFSETWNAITSKASTMKTNIDAYLDSIYNQYNPGEVDTSKFQDPLTVASQLGTKEGTTGSYAYAGAEVSMLGLEATFDQLMQIYLVEDDVTVPGQLYFQGGPDSGLSVGELYSPAQFTGAIYIGYESSDGKSQFAELEQSFRIESAEDKNGNSVDTVTSEQYNQQTSEVNLTEEQLNSIASAIDDAQAKQEAAAQGDSGGGGGSGDSLFGGAFASGDNNVILYGIGGAVLLYLLGDN